MLSMVLLNYLVNDILRAAVKKQFKEEAKFDHLKLKQFKEDLKAQGLDWKKAIEESSAIEVIYPESYWNN